MLHVEPPSAEVLQAFGIHDRPHRLPGGQGTSWQAGDVILKPESDAELQQWLGTELAGVPQTGFQLTDVLRAHDGRWVVEGWSAATVVPGCSADESGAWVRVIEAARAFHRATRSLPRPALLANRNDWWATADSAAWRERPIDVIPALRPVVSRLTRALEPLGPNQLVHGDLTGNVLLTACGPPAIIDISPYWRPTAYSEGIVVADAICWHGATSQLSDDCGLSMPAVARGLLFRVMTTNALQADRPDPALLDHELDRYTATADELGL